MNVFDIISRCFGYLDQIKVFGNISIFHILVASLVAAVIIKIIKGGKN